VTPRVTPYRAGLEARQRRKGPEFRMSFGPFRSLCSLQGDTVRLQACPVRGDMRWLMPLLQPCRQISPVWIYALN
jgi:hypothetical protein